MNDFKPVPNWKKYKLLMWKNYTIFKRHKCATLIEIFIPAIFCGILMIIRSLVDIKVIASPSVYRPLSLNPNLGLGSTKALYILYYPKIDAVDDLMQLFNNHSGVIVKAVPNRIDLNRKIDIETPFAVIEFPDSYADLTSLPDNLEYFLRFPGELRTGILTSWDTNNLYTVQPGRNYKEDDGGIPPGYYREGFLAIQHTMFRAYMEIAKLSTVDVDINRFPVPPFILDSYYDGLYYYLVILLFVSYTFYAINITRYIAVEKEMKTKEIMKIMGIPGWIQWAAWFTLSMFLQNLSNIIIVSMLHGGFYKAANYAVFNYSNGIITYIILSFFSISVTTSTFLFAVFFNNASTAAAVATLIWFGSFYPFVYVLNSEPVIYTSHQILSCMFANSMFGYIFQRILKLEGLEMGLQWSNLFSDSHNSLAIGYLLVFIIIDSIIYLLLALYVDAINPGDYGIPMPWNFLCKYSFWAEIFQNLPCICFSKSTDEFLNTTESTTSSNFNSEYSFGSNFEEEPINLPLGVEIKKLRKVYKENRVAVEGLYLNMYENQITVLLGHNGAGKTTTMSMLTGLIPPTSGTAYIYDKNIMRHMNNVRGSLGFCPQHDVLFNELTVKEHLKFYLQLKGVTNHETINREINKFAHLLNLQTKLKTLSCNLSGGMKRKLSVAIALCGNSKTVFLDEPTSGMDPAARRNLWDLILLEKKDRTILLSTHFMDEADVLGDRIAIMAHGELKACGSPFFLKKTFGIGYNLIFVKDKDCDPDKVTQLLKKHIPNIEINTNIGSELSYILHNVNSSKYQALLQDIEENSIELHLLSLGISQTSLEEVFLNIGSDSQKTTSSERRTSAFELMDRINHLKGYALFKHQVLGLFQKKYKLSKRNWFQIVVQILAPVVLVSISISAARKWHITYDLPPINLSPDLYDNPLNIIQVPSLGDLTLPSESGRKYNLLIANYPGQIYITDLNMDKVFLKLADQYGRIANHRLYYGASLTENLGRAWFNNYPLHTAPIALNNLHNALLKSAGGKNHSITVWNYPLPFGPNTRMNMLNLGSSMGFQIAFNTGNAFSIVMAFIPMCYISERASRAKLLQFVSGVSVLSYWATAYIWDYALFLFVAFLEVVTIYAFQEHGFDTISEIAQVYQLFILFGFACIPLLYVLSNLFHHAAAGFTYLVLIFLSTGMGTYLLISNLRTAEFGLENVANKVQFIFLLFPNFALTDGIGNFHKHASIKLLCEIQCKKYFAFDDRASKKDCFSVWQKDLCGMNKKCCGLGMYDFNNIDGVAYHLCFLFGFGVVMLTLHFFIEYKIITLIIENINIKRYARTIEMKQGLLRQSQTENDDNVVADIIEIDNSSNLKLTTKPSIYQTADSDVITENNRINSLSMEEILEYKVLLKNLTKYYKSFLAVNNINLGVRSSECFGLLGANGAGKTTTFKILTGDQKMSSGDVWINGKNIRVDMKNVYKDIGYCPQYDALLDNLTGREMLHFFAMLHGIPQKNIRQISGELAHELNFHAHIDKLTKNYSGGNKRKLSVALATLSNPSVLFLDEPTTGMDPGSRRQLWNVICRFRDTGKTIVLTSHSMEECEALCTRLVVMVNGTFKCLGSIQHIKNKFSHGFILTVKVRPSNVNESLRKFMMNFGQRKKSQYTLKQRFSNGLLAISTSSIWSRISRKRHRREPKEPKITQSVIINENSEMIKDFVREKFANSVFRCEYCNMMTFFIPPENIKWSYIFGIMETAKSEYSRIIESYLIEQTTLEQVFLSFTKYQENPQNE